MILLRYPSRVLQIHDGGSFPRPPATTRVASHGRGRHRVKPLHARDLSSVGRRTYISRMARLATMLPSTSIAVRLLSALVGQELLPRATSRQHSAKTLHRILVRPARLLNGSSSENCSKRSGDDVYVAFGRKVRVGSAPRETCGFSRQPTSRQDCAMGKHPLRPRPARPEPYASAVR